MYNFRFQEDEIIAYLDCRWVTTETLMQNSYASSPEYDTDVFDESLTVRITFQELCFIILSLFGIHFKYLCLYFRLISSKILYFKIFTSIYTNYITGIIQRGYFSYY